MNVKIELSNSNTCSEDVNQDPRRKLNDMEDAEKDHYVSNKHSKKKEQLE